MDIFSELNESQREAVRYNDGASLVIAGAGSGKTRVITHKIACLIEQGLPADRILALTFTNKAAREMKERVAQLLGQRNVSRLWIGTFHSVFARILRAEAERVGFTPNYVIYDASDTKSLLKAIIKEKKLDEKQYRPSDVYSRISFAKNNLITPKLYAANSDLLASDRAARRPAILDIYQTYWQRCFAAGAMDFDDLLLYTNILFRDNPDVLARYQDIFQFILVDEYQDTNFSQHLIVKKLAEKNRRICVVGDDAQSIYSFRGAKIENILRFQDQYQNCRVFKLEQNYRSTQNIVNAANSLISKNKDQLHKTVFSENEQGSLIRVINAYSDRDEATRVSEEIRSLRGHEYSQMVVLYRTHAQSRVLEEAFLDHDIPYKIYGGTSFYQRKEIKDVLSYFRLAVNENDDEAFKRVVNFPVRGIGDVTLSKLIVCAGENGTSLTRVAQCPDDFALDLNARTKEKLSAFAGMIHSFNEKIRSANAYELAAEIIHKTGIMQAFSVENTQENISRRENVEELQNAVMEFCRSAAESSDDPKMSLADFMADVALLTDMDNDSGENADSVTLMTIHASKCTEFRDVFIVGVEENLLPSCSFSDDDLEEERRLMYVAITRAKENCYISYARQRFRNGQLSPCLPSRFISDIDERYLDLPLEFRWRGASASRDDSQVRWSHRGELDDDFRGRRFSDYESEKEPYKPFKATPPPPKLRRVETALRMSAGTAPASAEGLDEGIAIRHERFGKGSVLSIEGEGDSRKMWVLFDDGKKRQLMLKFAKFEIVG